MRPQTSHTNSTLSKILSSNIESFCQGDSRLLSFRRSLLVVVKGAELISLVPRESSPYLHLHPSASLDACSKISFILFFLFSPLDVGVNKGSPRGYKWKKRDQTCWYIYCFCSPATKIPLISFTDVREIVGHLGCKYQWTLCMSGLLISWMIRIRRPLIFWLRFLKTLTYCSSSHLTHLNIYFSSLLHKVGWDLVEMVGWERESCKCWEEAVLWF